MVLPLDGSSLEKHILFHVEMIEGLCGEVQGELSLFPQIFPGL